MIVSRSSPEQSVAQPVIGQLIYRSISTVPAGGALEISDILSAASDKNRERGLTGVLTVADGHFIQVLEGDDHALDDLLGSLRQDRRHTGMVVLDRRHVAQRDFADWAMVSPRLTPAFADRLTGLLAGAAADLDAFLPILKSALAAQERAAEIWQSRERSGEQA